MKKLIIALLSLTSFACASQRFSGNSNCGIGDTRTVPVKSINADMYLLETNSTDDSYGYTSDNPINVGGIHEGDGPINERRFLNALLGPNGEPVSYYRAGSCCAFKTPNGMINNTGMLDIYKITWEGCPKTFDIYINMYDKGDLLIPVGFTAK